MRHVLKDSGGITSVQILAWLGEILSTGAEAAVPANLLPLLSGPAGCCPLAHDNGTMVFIFRPARSPSRLFLALERGISVLILLFSAPFCILIGILVWLLDGWPVIYQQTRWGLFEKRFEVYKFRTMIRDSERLQERLHQRQATQGSHLFKLERDPRVTRLGSLLRRTFIDELPQLINVVRGEMRLVGPRPLPEKDQQYNRHAGHLLRYQGRPGMTGLWQVSGRNRLSFDAMCLLDLYYLGNRSAFFDLWLLLRTMGVILQEAHLYRKGDQHAKKARPVKDASHRHTNS